MENSITDIQSFPVPHSYVLDESLRNELHGKGFKVVGGIRSEKISELNQLYNSCHDLKETGMFYTLYSKDIAYRQYIFDSLNKILTNFYNEQLADYKIAYNIFVVKNPGKESEFFVHQDPSMVDEFKYSPLHIWIPLCDIDVNNGALCLTPRTNHLYMPYRSVAFPNAFEEVNDLMRDYMEPIYMKAGEAIFFDPRVVHCSLPNFSNSTRVAVLTGVVPKEAGVVISHQEPDQTDKVELIKQKDDFYIQADDFYLTCKCRPALGSLEKIISYKPPVYTKEYFLDFAKKESLSPVNLLPPSLNTECIMYGEPIQANNKYHSKNAPAEAMSGHK